MINLTVKTLDSRNHEFEVEDDITVAQFKEQIASQIDIPAETQRIIYCGRVLKDEFKLRDYDVNGKVVHLVQRAPPSENQGAPRAPSPMPTHSRTGSFPFRNRLDNIYLGSMQIPATLLETTAPPPTHRLAASRLNVAKRMLRRTESVLNQLENPTARTEQTPQEEPQEEVTPVFEARVIVPTSLNEPIDEAFVFSAVQNPLFNNQQPSSSNTSTQTEAGSSSASNAEQSQEEADDISESPAEAPEEAQASGTSSEASASGETRPQASTNNSNDNISPTSEMADLLDQLSHIQIRLAPFLEQYQNFMRQDPTVAQEDSRKTQTMLNRVSEVLHFLGHAYHSLSDIIVRTRTPPPRPLLCRPILIQHSAVLQAGIPIQVEAEFNFNADTSAANQQQAGSNATPQAPAADVNVQGTAGEGQEQPSTPNTENNRPTATPQRPPQLFRFPIGNSGIAGIHVESVPLPFQMGGLPARIHTTQQPAQSTDQNAGDNPTASATANAGAAPSNEGDSQQHPSTSSASVNIPMFGNNPNVEIIMEVTPEGITIDSLEGAILGGNRAGEAFGGNMPTPPPDFIQSIMQVAGQIMTRGAPGVTIASPMPNQPTSTTAQDASSTANSQTTGAGSGPTGQPSGQNSQARGNTSTNPTTATHTRTSSRPHVHLAQHAMQGFDPFLPCNSHHVTSRRRNGGQAQATPASNMRIGAVPVNPANFAVGQFNPLYNIVHGILNQFHTVVRRNVPATTGSTAAPQAARSATTSESIPTPPSFNSLFPNMQNMNLSDLNPHGPTIAQLLQQTSDENYVEGESILNDLIMFLARNLTLFDVMQLNQSRLEPLMRVRRELRNFFLYRILNGLPNPVNTDRGVNRLLSEMQPFLENLERLSVRANIDIVRSTQMLFRARLPNIISLAASHSPNSLRMLVEQCRITARQLVALIRNSSVNGELGVMEVIEHMVTRYMQGIPQDVQQWTLFASRMHIQQFMANLYVPDSILQPYLVRRVDALTSRPVLVNTAPAADVPPMEAMDVDEQEPSGSSTESDRVTLPPLNLENDSEPLPKVVIGSEGWHSQVPADWVPLIARDTQRQRRQSQQPAFSDAYLSGMPSKRRKIVTSSKPQGSLPQVITESVRRAVTATGLANVTNLEAVSQAAGSDINIQSAYRDLLRTSVQSNLQDNEDFTPERFPNATNYFNKP